MAVKVSVVVPCYNVEQYIDQCVESLLHQSLSEVELIFVNDASTDGTLEHLLRYEQQCPDRICVVNLPQNRKQGGARNAGMQYANGEYVGFVDADDWVEPDMLPKMYQKAKEYHCDAVCCRMYRNLSGGEMYEVETAAKGLLVQDKSMMEGGGYFFHLSGGVGTLYRRSLLKEHQIAFPENIKCEDNYFSAMVGLHLTSVYQMPDYLYHYRENPDSTMLSRNDMSHFDRLDIEVMKIQKYQELGVFNRFYQEFERDFIDLYFCNTMYMMVSRFDYPVYEVFLRMKRELKKFFPDYKNNQYIEELKNNFGYIFLQLVDVDLNEEQFGYVVEASRAAITADE